jgi:hypothetical protein
MANIVTNATNTLLSHPAHSIILIYHPESGWHLTSRNQGLSFASRRSKKDPGNEVAPTGKYNKTEIFKMAASRFVEVYW